MQVLKSNLDASVNFIENADVGFIESRYVRRQKEYIIGYLSSQTGCNRGCKFCHLTTTGQTMHDNCTFDDFIEQAEQILEHYSSQNERADFINWNYMARGEPLANPVILHNSQEHFQALHNLSYQHELEPRFNVSTIIPKTLKRSISEMFPYIKPNIYYSMYSVDPAFRSHWLPGAMDLDRALELLKDYQVWSKQPIILHGAFIKGENDSAASVDALMQAVYKRQIEARFNIVRYNPYSPEQGIETDNYTQISNIIGSYMPVKTVERVGYDAHCSCGMFVNA